MSDETDRNPEPTDADHSDADQFDADQFDPEQLDPEQAAEIEAAMAEARARLSQVPAEVVIVNHLMGLYELAAIHLSADEPDLGAASLAIDAMSAVVDALGDRLGENASTMNDALANIRMAFVGIKAQQG